MYSRIILKYINITIDLFDALALVFIVDQNTEQLNIIMYLSTQKLSKIMIFYHTSIQQTTRYVNLLRARFCDCVNVKYVMLYYRNQLTKKTLRIRIKWT